MLVAILSDIHGNMEALCSCWEDMENFAVDQVVCLGDMIGYGPDPDEVLTSVRKRGVLCCMGNHELGVSCPSERHWFNTTALKGLDLTKELLSVGNLDYISSLPRSLVVLGARCVHGFPPDSVTSYLFQADDHEVTCWFDTGESVTFVGHTHELMLVWRHNGVVDRRELQQETVPLPGQGCILNAGSVGQPRDGDNRAKYLLWNTEQHAVHIRYVAYDIGRTVEKIRARGFPEYYASRLW